MRFEHRKQPVLPREQWLKRVARSVWLAAILIFVSLAVGVLGYHLIGELPWVDAILEASMILGGMGPVVPLQNDGIKIFASAYALYSGLAVITMTGIILAPWAHRLLHTFHAADSHDAAKNK